MHLVILVTIATAMAADVMHQRCDSGTELPEETDCYGYNIINKSTKMNVFWSIFLRNL